MCEYFLKKVSGNLSGPDPFRDLSDEEKAVYQINFTGFIPDVKEKEQEQRVEWRRKPKTEEGEEAQSTRFRKLPHKN